MKRLTPIFVVVAACFAYRLYYQSQANAGLELPRETPWQIAPRYDDPRVVTDGQLASVLERLVPRRDAGNTNVWLHALRLWGPKAEFDDANAVSGAELRDYFIDDAAFQALAGNGEEPLLKIDDHGAEMRPWTPWSPDRRTASAHTDDVLATLGEIGLPLTHSIQGRAGDTNVKSLLTSALDRFHLDQLEYEWSAISYARYVYPALSWKNEHGQTFHVRDLVDELIDHPLDEGVCVGTHRLEALAVLYRADEQANALPKRTRRRVIQHLSQVSRILQQTQHADGYWNPTWHESAYESSQASTLAARILATGHHLEWLALAPEEAQPPRESVVRAAQWIVRAMGEVDDRTLATHYGPLSHAARALCLWRSIEPADVLLHAVPVDVASRSLPEVTR